MIGQHFWEEIIKNRKEKKNIGWYNMIQNNTMLKSLGNVTWDKRSFQVNIWEKVYVGLVKFASLLSP